MKLSPKQKEVIRRMNNGWVLGLSGLSGRATLQKENEDDIDVRRLTFLSLLKTGAITRRYNGFPVAIFSPSPTSEKK